MNGCSTEERFAQRDKDQAHYASTVALNPDSHLHGVKGELEFSRASGLPVNTKHQVQGDGGSDFTLPHFRDAKNVTLDVKTSTFTGHDVELKDPAAKFRADLYVLAQHDTANNTTALIGWATKTEFQAAPTKTYGEHGVPTQFLQRHELHPMTSLWEGMRKPE